MDVLYLDESGKSGLLDRNQPFYVLAGVVVPEAIWRTVETAFNRATELIIPRATRPAKWELHATEIFNKSGPFYRMSDAEQTALLDAQIDPIVQHGLTLFTMVLDKVAFNARYPKGHPRRDYEQMAYEYILERFAFSLNRDGRDELGIVISDEQRGRETLIRASHALYRQQGTTFRRIDRILETTVFIPSHESCMLQIVDGAAYWCNRNYKDPVLYGTKGINAMWDRLTPLLDRDNTGRVDGVGLKMIP